MNFFRVIFRVFLVLGYLFIMLFGFLSGMFSESLIGSVQPWAAVLADVIVWFGVAVSLSPAVCLLMATFLREKPVIRRIVLSLPFALLAAQMLLGHVADIL